MLDILRRDVLKNHQRTPYDFHDRSKSLTVQYDCFAIFNDDVSMRSFINIPSSSILAIIFWFISARHDVLTAYMYTIRNYPERTRDDNTAPCTMPYILWCRWDTILYLLSDYTNLQSWVWTHECCVIAYTHTHSTSQIIVYSAAIIVCAKSRVCGDEYSCSNTHTYFQVYTIMSIYRVHASDVFFTTCTLLYWASLWLCMHHDSLITIPAVVYIPVWSR